MIIHRKRIRNVEPYLRSLRPGARFIIGIRAAGISRETLSRIGFTDEMPVGESVLPASSFGPVSRYNAEGKEIVHKDQPMETAYRMAEWHWQEWRGRYDSEEQSKIVDVPYKRYPRTFLPPKALEFSVAQQISGERLIITPPLTLVPGFQDQIIHTINLFLEIFNECEVFTENLESLLQAPVRRVNWHILPPGVHPWERLLTHLRPIIEAAPEGNQAVIRYRLEAVNAYRPDFVAVGRGGFHGYIVFGFSQMDLHVLESAYTGNATYVFRRNWENLSRLTKAEVLRDDLQEARLIHRENWNQDLQNLFARFHNP